MDPNTPKTNALYASLQERARALEDLRKRLAALRNDQGRIDLTNSEIRDEVYSLVRTAEGIGP